jgi:hypothetical protein
MEGGKYPQNVKTVDNYAKTVDNCADVWTKWRIYTVYRRGLAPESTRLEWFYDNFSLQ